MKECSKSIARRVADPMSRAAISSATGIDIGGKPDPLALYQELLQNEKCAIMGLGRRDAHVGRMSGYRRSN